jgi:hypothetical protein
MEVAMSIDDRKEELRNAPTYQAFGTEVQDDLEQLLHEARWHGFNAILVTAEKWIARGGMGHGGLQLRGVL